MRSIHHDAPVAPSHAALCATLAAALVTLSIAGTAFGLGPLTPAGGGLHFPPVQVANPSQWLIPQEVHNAHYPATLYLDGTPCSDPRQITPWDTEIGDLATARLIPYSWPFHVEVVQYVLIEDPNANTPCRAGLGHEVLLFVSDGDHPGYPPVLVETIHVPSAVVAPLTPRMVTIELDESIELAEGESLFVAVQMAGDPDGDRMCIMACGDDFESDLDTWSVDGRDPGQDYDWVLLEDFGVEANYAVGMVGMAPFTGFIFGG